MSSYQRRGLLTILVATLVVLAIMFFLSNYNRQDKSLVSDPMFSQKAQVLSLVESGKPLNEEAKGIIFQYLSGSKILQYDFTPAEKIKIIQALNKN